MAFIPESMFRNHGDYGHFLPSTYAPDDRNFQGMPYQFLMARSTSYTGLDLAEEPQPEDDMSDDGCPLLGEKKRRLNMEQVKALEKSFELGNKLEPERKMQLARALGLQPRQIAIWFQNRRARWKTKQLEKDYDVLRRKFESLKADNDALKSLNKELHSQLLSLKAEESTRLEAINLNNDNEGITRSNGSDDKSCVVNLNTTIDSTLLYLHPSNKNDVDFPTIPHLQGHKINNHTLASNEPYTDTFVGVEENPGYWSWPGQQNFQ